MDDVLHLFVIAAVGTILAIVLAEFAKSDPNAKTGVFGKFQSIWGWSIKNIYGNDEQV